MTVFVPFKAEHIPLITVQAAQTAQLERSSPDDWSVLESDLAFSAFVDGRCVGAAGLAPIPMQPHRALAWALFAADLGPVLLESARFIRRVLASSGFSRIEATVDVNHDKGHRLAKLLGFRLEAPDMINYFGTGMNAALYARTV